MKRICFLVDSVFSIGGVQRVTAVIAKELAKDYDVTILTLDQENQKDTKLYDLEKAKICYRFFSYPNIGNIKKRFCRIFSGIYLKLQLPYKWYSNLYARSSFPSEQRNALAKKLTQGHYDIIIGVHAPLAARLATLKNQLPNTRLFGWIHNSFEAIFGEDSHYYIGAKRKRHYIYQFMKLNHVVVLCQNDAYLYNKFDYRFNPIVIYNPLTLKPGKASNGRTKRFLTVGRFSPLHKGIDLLIEAFRFFAEKNKEWQLDIVGDGEEKDKYHAMIKQYQLEDRITIHPFTNDIQNYYSSAQVYVLSSRWEGMPLVLVEAMSHGLPIVTSDLPVCQEILRDFGIYFKNKDIQDLALRLHDATHLKWQEKSLDALRIAQQFSIEKIIGQWKSLIDS